MSNKKWFLRGQEVPPPDQINQIIRMISNKTISNSQGKALLDLLFLRVRIFKKGQLPLPNGGTTNEEELLDIGYRLGLKIE